MNIYQIEQDFLAIFDELEENGGELTPELEEKLVCTQENFKEKIENYTKVIKLISNERDAIKAEQKRLKDLDERKSKVAEKLKSVMIDAIEKFGDTKKSGVRYLDYGTGEVSIRNTQAVDVDEDKVKAVGETIKKIMSYNKDCNQLDCLDSIDSDNIINTLFDVDFDDEGKAIPGYEVKVDDLNHINLKLSLKVPVKDLIDGKGYSILKEINKYTDIYSCEGDVSKTELKSALKENGAAAPYIARLVTNKNISIK